MAYDDLKAGLAKRLGVSETDVSDEKLLEALDESLAEQAGDTNPESESPAEPVVVGEPVLATASLPEGVVTIDATVLAQLQDNAKRGAEARAEQDKARRDGLIATALSKGQITSASAEGWRKRLEENETLIASAIAALPENTVPVEEIGHASAVVGDDDAYPAHWKR